MIAYSKPSFTDEEMSAASDCLASDYEPGSAIAAFESEFRAYVGVKHAIFTNSCTSALKLAYKYYVEAGKRFYWLLQPNTYSATWAAAEEMGLRVVSEDESGGSVVRVAMHYGSIQQAAVCEVEDSAHRIEANDPLVGAIRCYSFHEQKNLACGRGSSGGMLVTNDKEIYDRCRLWANDGRVYQTDSGARYEAGYALGAVSGGFDGHDLAASIGRVQLARLPDFQARRTVIRDAYNSAFDQDWAGLHLYPYFVASAYELAQLQTALSQRAIQTAYHYPTVGGTYRDDWLAVSLPIYPLLSDSEVMQIIESVKAARG